MRALGLACLVVLGGLALPLTTAGPGGVAVPFNRVCLALNLAGSFDATEQAANAVPADVPLGTGPVVGTAVAFFGAIDPFVGLLLRIDVPAQDLVVQAPGGVDYQLWDGTGWRDLDEDDGTNDLHRAGAVTFDMAGSARRDVSGFGCAPGQLHYVRMTTNRPYATSALAGQVLALE